MLSSVLNSKRAIQVNIAIMRAFVRLREILASTCQGRSGVRSYEFRHTFATLFGEAVGPMPPEACPAGNLADDFRISFDT
jgi:hypothetical protein